ncbi:DUF2267 domain-containing protein [Kitasatospora cineracea]|uniref:DUF2267 domain-containing protein n=1 Tax=Kitasatospora cineracea TaxID=88074 RepID=UPI0036DAE147
MVTTRYRHLLRQVRHLGRYPTDAEAERVLDAVLALLRAQLTGDERGALAAPLALPRPVTAPAFVESLAHALGTSLAAARWDASSAAAALTDDDDLTDRLLDRLPRGYALLFGRADLVAAA